MAWIKLSNGGVNQVDDDELRDLILAGAGEEIDGPAPAPEPAPQRQPYGSQNDPNNHSGRIKELMDYASSFDASGTPEAIARVKAEANREIEKLHAKYGSGSVNQWVRSQLSGGATKRQSKLGAATEMLNSVFDPMERSRIAKNIRSASGEFAKRFLEGSGSPVAAIDAAKALVGQSDMADESLFGTLQDAERKAALDRAVVKPADQLTDEEKAAVEADNQSTVDAAKQAVGAMAQQVAEDPNKFASQLAMDVLSPSNIAGEALTGPLGALTKRVVGASKTAQRARRLLDADPIVDVGATYRRVPTIGAAARGAAQIGEETIQGAFSEAAQTGDVTAAGTVTNMAPAIAGTALRGAAAGIPNAAKRTDAGTQPSQIEPPAQPEPPAPPAPEPVAPTAAAPAAPVADVAPEPVKPIPSRLNQPRETDATRAAKKVAKKEALQARSEAESQIAFHTKKAKEFAKAGMQADAEKLLDNARPQYDKVWGQMADFVFNKDKEILAAEAKKTASKPARQSKIAPPKTDAEAQQQVAAAVAEGTPEAIEAARPAIEVLNPVGDDAAKAIDELKAQAEVAKPPKIEPPPAAAPEPVKKAPKKVKKTELEPKEDPTVRPVLKIGTSRQEVPSTFDWSSDPFKYTADMYGVVSDKALIKELKASQRSDLATKVMAVNKALEDRRMETIEGTELSYGDLAQEAEFYFQDTPLTDAIKDRSSIMIDDFVEEQGVSRADLEDAIAASIYTKEEQAIIKRAVDALREDAPAIEKATANEYTGASQEEIDAQAQADLDAEIAAGNIQRNPNALTEEDVRGWPRQNKLTVTKPKRGQQLYSMPFVPEKILEDIKAGADATVKLADEKVGHYTQRISDEFTQMTDEAFKRGGPIAAQSMDDLTKTVRRMDDQKDKDVSRRMTQLSDAIRKVPTFSAGIMSNLEKVSDALEGNKVELNEWQQELHDVIRSSFDELGAEYEQVTGNKMRKDYFPRHELRGRINDMISRFRSQSNAKGLKKDLTAGPMTLEKARGIVSKFGAPADPTVARSITNQSTVLQSLFEKDEAGNVSLAKDADGTPLIQREAAYLLMMPRDGKLEPMLPDLFVRVGELSGYDKKGVPIAGPPFHVELKPNVKMPSPEDMKILMDAEAMRILENREEYDPDGKTASYHNDAGKWRVDASLINARLMPDLGKEFYDRNPINVAVNTIRRQTSGLARQKALGVKKEILLSKLEALAPYFRPEELGLVKEGDGYRLAEKSEKSVYDRSLLRSIEDVAIGSSRPGIDDSFFGNASAVAEKIARYAVLSGKLIPAVKNEIMQLGASGAYGPEVMASYATNRAKVAAMQMESGARQIGEKLSRSVIGAADLARSGRVPKKWAQQQLDRLVSGDPISKADIRGMADASAIIGATPAERLANSAMNLIGSFSASNKAADIAAHYTGYAMFNDMVHRRSMDKAGFSSEKGLLPEDLKRTVTGADLDRAAALLDSQGWPIDADAAEKILNIAGPFISEFKSKLSGKNTPLFTAKVAREKWAKSATWLMSIPMAITSGQIAAIRRAARRGNYKEATLRAAKLGASGAGATYLSMLAAQNPQEGAIAGAIATGQYAAATAALGLTGGDYNPEDEYANIEMAALQSDWDKGEGVASLANRTAIAAQLAGKSMWMPRFLDTRMASEADMKVGGRRSFTENPVFTGLKTAFPAISAAGQSAVNIYGDLGLAGTALDAGRTGDAASMIAGTVFPSVREGTGKLRANLKSAQSFARKIDPEAINKGVEPLTGTGVGDLTQSNVRTKVNKLPR